MKQSIFFMVASIGLLAGCSQIEQDIADVNSLSDGDLVERVIFEVLPVKDGDDPETKASAVPNGGSVGFVWEATDTVGIYPDKGSQVYFNIEDGVGTSSVSFTGGGWALKQNSTYTSYYPFVGDIYLKRGKIPVSFAGQKQIGTTSPFVGARYYLATGASTSENGVLRFSYNTLNTIINVNATLPAGTYTKMSLTTEDPLFVEEGTYSLDERTIVGTKFTNTLEIDLENVVLTEEATIPIYIMSAPVDLKGKEVMVKVISSDGKKYVCVKTPSKAYAAGTRYGLTCDEMESEDDNPNVIKYMNQTKGNTPLDICVIPEGFVEGELDLFVNLATEGIDFLFATEPFKSYRDYFNVYFLKVASQESGASITDGNGTITTQKNTYFNARWGESSYSDMAADNDVVYDFVAASCPEIVNGTLAIQDVPILMIINDTRYGGICHSVSDGRGFAMVPYTDGGGPLSWNINSLVASQNEPIPSDSNYNDFVKQLTSDELNALGINIGSWKNTLIHEFGGHCFARFMDEYWYTSYYTSQSAISYHSWPVPYGLNVSGYYDSVPWGNLLSDLDDLINKDSNYGRIGKFQGGDVSLFNRWRSEMISCMIDNRPYFSTWQRVLIVKRIMEKVGLSFSLDPFYEKDVTIDPLRDGASSLVLGFDSALPVHEVPLLPPPVLTSSL